jgi:uncharacterized membrane protein YgcG
MRFLPLLVSPTLWPGSALAAEDFGPRIARQAIYDPTSILPPDASARLQQRVGSEPTVVYLRSKAATAPETEADAKALMDAWNVESRTGASDGLVVFLNFEPGDTHHGQVAIFAGRTLDLSRAQLQQITDDMRPALRDGHPEQALDAALTTLGSYRMLAQAGGQQPTSFSQRAESPSPPLGIVALIVGGLSLFLLVPLFIIGIAVLLVARGVRGRPTGGWSSNSSSSSSGSTSSSSTSDGGSSGSSSF